MRPSAGPLLVVDDDENLLFVFARALERAGWSVVTAPSVAAAKAHVVPPAAIICDHQLGDGTEADVAAAWPGIPMVAVSGYQKPPAYAGPWLAKPVLLAELLAAVEGL
jgi:ActR/RegA family two-component response regulator